MIVRGLASGSFGGLAIGASLLVGVTPALADDAPANRSSAATPGGAPGTAGEVRAGAEAAGGSAGEATDAEGVVDEEVIVVTGTRSETPRAASPVTTEVIDRQRLAESGVQTAAEALAQRPGLWVDRTFSGATGITMQGLGPPYTLILVDGARQVGRNDGVLDLDRFAVEDLEQIEVVRGPSSVLYGSDALGGVVNLVSRPPRDGYRADALARLDGRLGYEARGRVAGGARGFAGALVGTVREQPAITLDPTPDTIATTFNGFQDGHVTARGAYQRERDDGASTWRFDVAGDYLQRDLRGVDANATGAVLDRRNLVETAMAQAIARWTGERTRVRIEADASLYRDQYLLDQRMADALDQYQLTDENLVETRGLFAHHLGKHELSAGGELLREALTSDRLETPGDRMRGAIYVQDEWRIGAEDRLLVVPAARLDVDSQFGTHPTPRVAARWQGSEELVIRGSLGMGFRAPSFKELLLLFQNPGAGYVVAGNPDLGPEKSTSVQLGGEWRPRPWLWLGADAFVNRVRDMIFIITAPDDGSGTLQFTYDNIGRARTLGFETHAMATRGRAGIELGYALTRTRDLDADRALENIPMHRFTTTLRWRDKAQRFTAFATAVVTGHRPLYLSADPQQATLTPRRVEIRARVAKRFTSGVGGFLGVDNLLDAGDPVLDRILPRTVYAGVELHLEGDP